MQRTTLSATILGLFLFCCGGVLIGSEAVELRERAKAMQKEASVMAEQGNKEQAERLEKESMKLLEYAEQLELKAKGRGEKGDRSEFEKEGRQLKERLHHLLAKQQKLKESEGPDGELAAVREQIAATEQAIHSVHAHHTGQNKLPPEFQAQAKMLEAASRRIHHLRVAAENLKLAEAHDLAHQITEQAEAMQRDVQEGKMRLAAEMQKAHGGDHGSDVVGELRNEIERLRAEVKELSQKIENR